MGFSQALEQRGQTTDHGVAAKESRLPDPAPSSAIQCHLASCSAVGHHPAPSSPIQPHPAPSTAAQHSPAWLSCAVLLADLTVHSRSPAGSPGSPGQDLPFRRRLTGAGRHDKDRHQGGRWQCQSRRSVGPSGAAVLNVLLLGRTRGVRHARQHKPTAYGDFGQHCPPEIAWHGILSIL